MIYEFRDALFSDAANDLSILYFLEDAKRGRLYIAIHDDGGFHYLQWRARTSAHFIDLWDLMLNWSIADSAVYRSGIVIVDCVQSGTWGRVPHVTLAEAQDLASNGFSLLIENGRNDRNFILSMVNKSTRNLLLHLEKRRTLNFVGAGGIGEIKAQLDGSIANRRDRAHSHFVMIDSDAEVPGSLSAAAASIVSSCLKLQVEYCCLQRRAIENYIPMGAIFDFINQSKNAYRNYLRDLGGALKKASADQRAHFPMKAGLKAPSRAQSAFYGDLDPQTLGYLRRRFPDRMASTIFSDSPSPRLEQQIESETAKQEIRAMVDRVLFYARGPHA